MKVCVSVWVGVCPNEHTNVCVCTCLRRPQALQLHCASHHFSGTVWMLVSAQWLTPMLQQFFFSVEWNKSNLHCFSICLPVCVFFFLMTSLLQSWKHNELWMSLWKKSIRALKLNIFCHWFIIDQPLEKLSVIDLIRKPRCVKSNNKISILTLPDGAQSGAAVFCDSLRHKQCSYTAVDESSVICGGNRLINVTGLAKIA